MVNENNISKRFLPGDLLPEDLLPEDLLTDKNKDKDKNGKDRTVQSHVHEFLGSTRLAGSRKEEHNHRFAGVTSGAIPLPGGNHKHVIFANTDFTIDHLHEIAIETGPAIDVGGNKHVHMAVGNTTVDAGHSHSLIVATLIEDPTD